MYLRKGAALVSLVWSQIGRGLEWDLGKWEEALVVRCPGSRMTKQGFLSRALAAHGTYGRLFIDPAPFPPGNPQNSN